MAGGRHEPSGLVQFRDELGETQRLGLDGRQQSPRGPGDGGRIGEKALGERAHRRERAAKHPHRLGDAAMPLFVDARGPRRVAKNQDEADHPPLLVEERRHDGLQQDVASRVEGEAFGASPGGAEPFEEVSDLAAVHEIEEAATQKTSPGRPQQTVGGAVRQRDPPLGQRHGHALAEGVEHRGELASLDRELPRRAGHLALESASRLEQAVSQLIDLGGQQAELVAGADLQAVLRVDRRHQFRLAPQPSKGVDGSPTGEVDREGEPEADDPEPDGHGGDERGRADLERARAFEPDEGAGGGRQRDQGQGENADEELRPEAAGPHGSPPGSRRSRMAW